MRFQADLGSKDGSMLANLKRELEIPSNADLLVQAVTILRWLVGERREGRRITSVGDRGPVRELASPLLERVAPATGLPHVEIDWTDEEVREVSALISAEPAEPAPALVAGMKRLHRETADTPTGRR